MHDRRVVLPYPIEQDKLTHDLQIALGTALASLAQNDCAASTRC
ncbi:hypothetical protein GCM10023176_26430 [Micromonospora coerulea]|uniref:Uncharacterized protein n=1 Tax=Micromonospora coerulea TaxID=47856 RepID=A0ABP8SJX5_9ACTN